MKIKLFFFSAIFLIAFILFSYTIAKENWTKIDFDTTVRLQNHIPRKFDINFSLFSIFGSAEITFGFCFLMAILALSKFKWLAILGWLMIIPASLGEIFGKLVLYHPAPPYFFHRTTLITSLPSFYIHTDFSYPSGHMARVAFLGTLFCVLVFFSKKSLLLKYFLINLALFFMFIMGLTRIYLGEHWLSDVLGGTILGASIGFLGSMLILRHTQDQY